MPPQQKAKAYCESLLTLFRTVIGGQSWGLSIAHLVQLVEETINNSKMNNQSKAWQDYKGTSSSWNDGRRRHDARSSDSYREGDYGSDYYKDKKKQMSRKEAKKLRKMDQLERESRGKAVDPQYNPADKVCRFFAIGKCSHGRGDHYGYPFQRDKIADETGHLTEVPCPLQEQFQYSYGKSRMT